MRIENQIKPTCWILVVSFFCSVALAAPPAAIELTSLLEAFNLHHKSGQLDLNGRTGANGAFIPANAKAQVTISQKGSKKPLAAHSVRVRPLGKPWSNIQVADSSLTFKFFTRQETDKPDNNMQATVDLFHDGELVALANPGGVAWSPRGITQTLNSPSSTTKAATKPTASVPQIDVVKEAFLATTLDSEQQIYEALKRSPTSRSANDQDG